MTANANQKRIVTWAVLFVFLGIPAGMLGFGIAVFNVPNHLQTNIFWQELATSMVAISVFVVCAVKLFKEGRK